MANEKNLIPFSERSKDEAREYGRIGGIQSGVARRRKKTLKQAAELVMSLPVTDKRVNAKLKRMGIDVDDADNQMAVIAAMLGKALAGDHKAAALIFDLLDDEQTSATEQTESHNALVDAIRMRNNED